MGAIGFVVYLMPSDIVLLAFQSLLEDGNQVAANVVVDM